MKHVLPHSCLQSFLTFLSLFLPFLLSFLDTVHILSFMPPSLLLLHSLLSTPPSHPFSLFLDGEDASSVSTIAALQGEVSELKLELVRLEQSKAEDDGVIEGLKTQLTEMTLEKEGKAEPPPPPTESDKVANLRSIQTIHVSGGNEYPWVQRCVHAQTHSLDSS